MFAQLPNIVSFELLVDVVRQTLTVGMLQLISLMVVVALINRMINKYFEEEKEKRRREKQKRTYQQDVEISKAIKKKKHELYDSGDGFGMTRFKEKEQETGDGFEYDEPSYCKGWEYD